MSPFQQGIREAVWILFAAMVLGFSYTASFKKGLFSVESNEHATLHNRPPSNLPIIDLAVAQSLLESGSALFVDGRNEFDYKLGHIKGAINIPLKEFESRKSLLASLPKDRTIVTYCDGAECNSSIELAARLYAEGFTDVRIFFGGWNEWNAQRLPTERSEP